MDPILALPFSVDLVPGSFGSIAGTEVSFVGFPFMRFASVFAGFTSVFTGSADGEVAPVII